MKTSFIRRVSAVVFAAAFIVLQLTGCASSPSARYDKLLSPKNPVCVYVWNYYNGNQKLAFDSLVAEFNETVGRERGVIVEVSSQGSIDGVRDALMDSLRQKVGAQNIPDLVAAYSDIAYTFYEMGALVDIAQYMTPDELAEYLPGYLDEGRIDGGLYNFPVSKSTETFMYNKTDCDVFTQATGVSIESITTLEELAQAAKAYYEWTDSLTPDIREDGRALFGRDAVDNYIINGLKQLGHPAFTVSNGSVTVDLDRASLKTLWDNYYIPFINGYYGAYGKFRSDDTKTGLILAYIGSSSSAGFFPQQITRNDDTSYAVDVGVMGVPFFENAVEKSVVQQGAGYSLVKTDEKRQYAAVVFLKWLTDTKQNTEFSALSGYLPVKKEALSKDNLERALSEGDSDQVIKRVLISSGDAVSGNTSYASPPFSGATDARYAMRNALVDACVADRAAVVEKIASGMSREEAVSSYSTPEYFDRWYASLTASVNEIVK